MAHLHAINKDIDLPFMLLIPEAQANAFCVGCIDNASCFLCDIGDCTCCVAHPVLLARRGNPALCVKMQREKRRCSFRLYEEDYTQKIGSLYYPSTSPLNSAPESISSLILV